MFETVLTEGAGGMGISLSSGVTLLMKKYHDLLYESNRVMDLTAVPEGDEAARSHFLDSIASAALLPQGASVLDLGSGAGLPGVPLKILRPDLRLTLLDSNGKRTAFLAAACAECGLDDVKVLTGRAEELVQSSGLRESFDVCISRAVARMTMLAELSLPYVRVGGLFIAMKAGGCEEELSEANRAVTLLGGAMKPLTRYRVPGTQAERVLVQVQKNRSTPPAYPRRFAKIKAKPL